MKLKEIIQSLENKFPLAYQEDYDNAGLLCGQADAKVSGILLCLDVTEEVMDEAIENGYNFVIAHHPLIFKGLKKIQGRNYVERSLIKAIKNDIAIYALHTNLDNMWGGLNTYVAELLGLQNIQILKPLEHVLYKICVFCPDIKLSDGQYVPGFVRNEMFNAGAGFIGDYDSCSFNYDGLGTYRGLEGTDPFIGSTGKTNVQKEVKIETIVPQHLKSAVIKAMLKAHPYEEVAYDIYPLDNSFPKAGAGVIGELQQEISEKEVLELIKNKLNVQSIRHTQLLKKTVKKIAFCGGAGSFLLKNAIGQKADFYVSGDFKYHEFFDADGKIVIADIGHYESEQFMIDLLHEYLINNFTTFAISKTKVITNPINYF